MSIIVCLPGSTVAEVDEAVAREPEVIGRCAGAPRELIDCGDDLPGDTLLVNVRCHV
ncbi:hypothetical protein [Kitasatospora sp. NPDC058218]|uniref:hypothetical protein n=1 Tax=Kitasatospora sp. NPDC058218 TaxID=3346385 RepID=UPI0036DD98DB